MLNAQAHERDFRDALDSVLRSSTFARSERLKKFLNFVCDCVLAGKSDELNEYLIGVEVFGRTPGYSPSEDSIVRRQAHALRKKLEEYYAREGSDCKIRVELPLGHYCAVFRIIEERQAPEPELLPQPMILPVSDLSTWKRWSAVTLVAALLFTGGVFAGKSANRSRSSARIAALSPSMNWLWGSWLADSSGATICLTNPKTMVVKQYAEPHAESKAEKLIPTDSPRAKTIRTFFNLQPGGELREYPSVGQAKMGEAVAAVELTSLLSSYGGFVRVEQTSFLGWNRARSENLILFGHSESTPWVDRLTAGYPIQTRPSQGNLPRRITVDNPGQNEQSMYAMSDRNPDTTYVLISMLPGIDGVHHLLSIAGLNGMATQFGAEFLTTPHHVDELAAALKAAGAMLNQRLPFQAVLQVEVRNNMVPLRGQIKLIRVLHLPVEKRALSMAMLSPSRNSACKSQ